MKPIRHFTFLILCTLLAACGNPNARLDEYIFYAGPKFQLKLVRYYRNIPFNYLGEQAVVMCQSENTGNFSGPDPQDAGWRMLGEAHSTEDETARSIAQRVQPDYQVIDDQTLVAKLQALNVSFDACGHFINWDPTRLPKDMIDTLEKPDSCAPNGPVDCRYYDFEGKRAPQYRNIAITGNGRLSFEITSPALRETQGLRIGTDNNGVLWNVERIRPETGATQFRPETIRSLPVSSLDSSMTGTNLYSWFEAALPERSMVIWPDQTEPCSGVEGRHAETHLANCAKIRFIDDTGNGGSLYIATGTTGTAGSDAPSLHSGTYHTADGRRIFASLAELREQLAGSRLR